MLIKDIYKKRKEVNVELKGWITESRGNDKIRFLVLNDGSVFNGIQLVVKEQAKKADIKIGSVVKISGKIKLTPTSKQSLEIVVKDFFVLQKSPEDFPIQSQKMLLETTREIPHIRHKTKTISAVMRIRSRLVQSIHNFFSEESFLNVASPIITSNDGEGAGETFVVDTHNKKNFFGSEKIATLGVTGQLHAEAYANGFGRVYTFAPTFRAETSNTTRHIAEFWMLEPEIAFYSMKDAIILADKLLKYLIKDILVENKEEIKFFVEKNNKNLFSNLKKYIDNDIKIITYTKAIELLKKSKLKFVENKIEFGINLSIEHEKYLVDELFKSPVAVVDYPKKIKAFYMKLNSDNKTVASFDILAPGVGEIIGGSERENNIEKLIKRIKELGIDEKNMEWYLEIRKFGGYKSSGFGMGFERLIMYITGMKNIKDVIPFPRTSNSLKM